MAKKVYTSKDFKQNEIQNALAHQVSTFPDGAKRGQLIYHTGLNAFFVCKNEDMTGGTSQKGAWGIGQVHINELYHDEDPNKVLITDTNNTTIMADRPPFVSGECNFFIDNICLQSKNVLKFF